MQERTADTGGLQAESARHVYFWVDGIHSNIRLEEDRHCILIVMGPTPERKKGTVAIQDGYRESEQPFLPRTCG